MDLWKPALLCLCLHVSLSFCAPIQTIPEQHSVEEEDAPNTEQTSTTIPRNSDHDVEKGTSREANAADENIAQTPADVLRRKELRRRIKDQITGVSYPEVWSKDILEDRNKMWQLFWISAYTDELQDWQIELLCAILCEYFGQCPPGCPGYYNPPWGGGDNSSKEETAAKSNLAHNVP